MNTLSCPALHTHSLGLGEADVVVGSILEEVLVVDVVLGRWNDGPVRPIQFQEHWLLTSSDQPNGTLGLGHDSSSAPERDLGASSRVKIVIREPDPHALRADRQLQRSTTDGGFSP